MSSYKSNVFDRIRESLAPLAPVDTALDYGGGDGWFAQRLMDTGLVREVVAVDVKRRKSSYVEPILYDGVHLPFPDRCFDLVYAIDAVHHTGSPLAALAEMLRCSRRHFVLKDHTYSDRLTKLLLAVFDELGNRRFGIPSSYAYQRGWEWLPAIERQGFALRELRHPIVCETRPGLARLANHYQFVGRWTRSDSSAASGRVPDSRVVELQSMR